MVVLGEKSICSQQFLLDLLYKHRGSCIALVSLYLLSQLKSVGFGALISLLEVKGVKNSFAFTCTD